MDLGFVSQQVWMFRLKRSLSLSGFSNVLLVTMVTLYHVDNVFGIAFNVMIN